MIKKSQYEIEEKKQGKYVSSKEFKNIKVFSLKLLIGFSAN